MTIFKSPNQINQRDRNKKSIFLAGSIDNGLAEDWQTKCEKSLEKYYHLLNPRVTNWNKAWKMQAEDVHFSQQVNWELNGLEKADMVLMHFLSKSKSPISLLEFGLMAQSKKMIVVCGTEFWRKGNVDIVCQRYDIPQYKSLDDAINELKRMAI
jgi:hypothetical protein